MGVGTDDAFNIWFLKLMRKISLVHSGAGGKMMLQILILRRFIWYILIKMATIVQTILVTQFCA
jgi:hypothetical protein